ncbi:MAG: hypothetical protein JSV04_07650 [Candidatus Heimdallarchaeota archaeon]|nr:MAG: hypothetical protein JSV04_07650 [Candidatus Heimdallarchaeota archaeon]
MSKSIRIFKKRLQISQKKWNTVQTHSLKTVNTILNILSRLNLTQRPDAFSMSLLTKFPDVPERLAFHLVELINRSLSDLFTVLDQFSDVVREMRKIENTFRLDVSIIARKQVVEGTEAWPHDLDVIEQAERTIQEIVDMYETELNLRKQLLEEIQESVSLKPLMITAHLVLWTSEVYIEPNRIHELIEEFSTIEKVCERVFQQDSYNSVPKSR